MQCCLLFDGVGLFEAQEDGAQGCVAFAAGIVS
jgi:hypothetical protein